MVTTTDRRSTKESGYVLATTALLLVPMMIFAAFAVDVGAWYSEAARLQRAADAASLAAVVHMPDTTAATAAAVDAAGRNGYRNGVDGVVVTFSAIGTREVRVDIAKPSTSYFGKLVLDDVTITRWGSADYVLSVPMGNPTSSIGTADLDLQGTNDPANYWLNAHSYQINVSTGDLLNSGGVGANPYYDDRGYVYVVNKPAGVEVDVEVLHAGRCKRPNWNNGRGEAHNQNTPNIEFSLYEADDTPRNHNDNIVPGNQFGATYTTDHSGNTAGASTGASCPTFNGDGTWSDPKWVTMYTIPAGATPGLWYLTAGTISGSDGHKNMYGLRLVGDNMIADYCSALLPATVTSGECPTINALDRLAVYIGENRPDPAVPVTAATFYFAEIAAVHAGKTMQIELWDPGEGSNYLQFLDPHGNIMPFRYRLEDRWGTPIAGWVDTTAVCAQDASTSHCMPAAHHNRLVTIEIPLAQPDGSDYTCNGADCWWKVHYVSTSNVDDTTTWAVQIIGDPVRLTE